ncbi:MAG: FmdB family zinc ribbon protein [Pseudomonadota bacterium]|jgi:putative FmdB family regulatory protein
MPIYEYECKACGHRLEKLQKISAEPLKDCPACEAAELDRLVSAAGFRLAGGGWYETDFKTGGKKNLASGDEGGQSNKTPSKDGAAA